MSNPDRRYDTIPKDTFLLDEEGRHFRCECRGNVFRPLRYSADAYSCNSCGAVYDAATIIKENIK